MFVVYFVINC